MKMGVENQLEYFWSEIEKICTNLKVILHKCSILGLQDVLKLIS